MEPAFVICPHPNHCDAIRHAIGSEDSIKCFRRGLIETATVETDLGLSNGVSVRASTALPNIPIDLVESAMETARVMRAISDHFRYFYIYAEFLNAAHAQVPYLDTYDNQYGFSSADQESGIEWVDPLKIVQTLPRRQWGRYGYNDGQHLAVTQSHSLAMAFTKSEIVKWLVMMNRHAVVLREIPGPVGPIYRMVSGSEHRVFTMASLELPYIAAIVQRAGGKDSQLEFAEVLHLSGSVHLQSESVSFDNMIDAFMEPVEDVPILTTQALRAAMVSVGAATMTLSQDGYLMKVRTLSPWLMFPASARVTEIAYAAAYPNYRSPIPDSALSSDREFYAWVVNSATSLI